MFFRFVLFLVCHLYCSKMALLIWFFSEKTSADADLVCRFKWFSDTEFYWLSFIFTTTTIWNIRCKVHSLHCSPHKHERKKKKKKMTTTTKTTEKKKCDSTYVKKSLIYIWVTEKNARKWQTSIDLPTPLLSKELEKKSRR